MRDPFKYRSFVGWEVGLIRVEEVWVEGDKIDIGALACIVCSPCTGCKSVPEEERDRRGEVSMRLIPTRWGLVEEH